MNGYRMEDDRFRVTSGYRMEDERGRNGRIQDGGWRMGYGGMVEDRMEDGGMVMQDERGR